MPGVVSGLHRHEWVKHGSCYSNKNANHYFGDSVELMHALNASWVSTLFQTHLGERLTTTAIRNAFDTSFGRGAGERVRVKCRRVGSRKLITELQIALGGTLGKLRLSDAILRGRKLTSRCHAGIVDTVGIAPQRQ
jgi:ribonuclease T2